MTRQLLLFIIIKQTTMMNGCQSVLLLMIVAKINREAERNRPAYQQCHLNPESPYRYIIDALRQVWKTFRKLNSYKMLGNTWVTCKTNVLPLPLLSYYFACVSAHAIKTGQCPSYIASNFVSSSFKATRYQHKLPSSHYNKLNHYLVSTYLPLSLHQSHASAFKLKL